jgi:hypothetical protein
MLGYQSLASVLWWWLGLVWMLLDRFRSNFFDLHPNLVFLALILELALIELLLALPYKCITATTAVTFPVFAFSRAFTSALLLFETRSVALIRPS